jgi:hypothetical protein
MTKSGSPGPELTWLMNGQPLTVDLLHSYQQSTMYALSSSSSSSLSPSVSMSQSSPSSYDSTSIDRLPFDEPLSTSETLATNRHRQTAELLRSSDFQLLPTWIDRNTSMVFSELSIGRLTRRLLLTRFECQAHLILDKRRVRTNYMSSSFTLDMNCEYACFSGYIELFCYFAKMSSGMR